MHKKLIGLLPLVWIVALGPYVIGHARSQSASSSSHPILETRRGYFDRSAPRVVNIAMMPDGQSIRSIKLDIPESGVSGPQIGQSVAFTSQAPSAAAASLCVQLPANSVARLPLGFQRLRITMADGAATDYDLIIVDTRHGHFTNFPSVRWQPTTSLKRPSHKGILASEKSALGGSNERSICRLGASRTLATL